MGSRFYWDKVVRGLYETRRGPFELTVGFGAGSWAWVVKKGERLIGQGEETRKRDAQAAAVRCADAAEGSTT